MQLRFHLEELEKMAAKGEERVERITYERTKSAKQQRAVSADAFAKLPVAETVEIIPEPVKADPICMSASARSGPSRWM